MKRFFALMLAALMLFSFAACGSGGSDQDDSGSINNGGSQGGSNLDTITFTETTVVDNAQYSIKVTGLKPDSYIGYGVEVSLENKTSDKNLGFYVDRASANGVDLPVLYSATVAAGKIADGTVTFRDSDLRDAIGKYTDVTVTFVIYDKDTSNIFNGDEVIAHIYPYGEENASTYVRPAQESDVILVDNESASVILTGYEQHDVWGYTANLYIVNKTENALVFVSENESVNGIMLAPNFTESVSAGHSIFVTMSWSDTSFAEKGITEVQNIEFVLRAYQVYNFFAGDVVNQKVTLNP